MRLIDADALLDILADRLIKVSERYGDDPAVAGAVSGVMRLVEVQPTIEQPHWTPCNAGMPKINKVVLVTCKTKNNRRFMDRAKWTGDIWTRATDEMYKVRSAKVEFLAWMPLPGLYRGE